MEKPSADQFNTTAKTQSLSESASQQAKRITSLSSFSAVQLGAAGAKEAEVAGNHVVRTAPYIQQPSTTNQREQPANTAKADDFINTAQPATRGQQQQTQPHYTQNNENNSAQCIPEHNSTLSVSQSPSSSTQQQQHQIIHHVHSSPVLTTQSFYSGTLVTDKYIEPSTIKNSENLNDLSKGGSSFLSNESAVNSSLPSTSVQSMDTALSSIFSSTEFFAGWIGGAGGVVIGHPFDTLKVRMQTRLSTPAADAVPSPTSAATPASTNTALNNAVNVGKNCFAGPVNTNGISTSVYKSFIENAMNLPQPAATSSGCGVNLGLNYSGFTSQNNTASAAVLGRQTALDKIASFGGLNEHHQGNTATAVIAPHNHNRTIHVAFPSFNTELNNIKPHILSTVAAKCVEPIHDPLPWSSRTGLVDVTKPNGMFAILDTMVRDEGARSIYRGMSFPLLSAGIINAVFFGTYQASSRIIDKVYPFRDHDAIVKQRREQTDSNAWRRRYATMFAAGAVGGAAQLSIAVPVEVIKIKLQVRTGRPKFTEAYRICGEIVRKRGIRGLYRGFGVQAMRDIPASAFYMSLYESLLDLFHFMRDREGVREQTSSILLAGGLAGMISWQIVIPFDVIKSRMQAGDTHQLPKSSVVAGASTSSLGADGGKRSWLMSCSLISAWRDVVREEGWRGLTRGMLPVSLRALPTNAAIFYLYEKSFAYLDGFGGSRKGYQKD